MSDANTIVRDRQCAIRRELDRRNISLKVVSFDSGIPYSTLLSYFPGDGDKQPAMLPASAVYALCGALPDDLLNLLAPAGFAIVRVPVGVDFDEIDKCCREFADKKAAFHHPDSEAGRDLGPTEQGALNTTFAGLRAVA